MSSKGHAVHFFKFIVENNLREGELRIPRSFVSKHWQGISNPLFLLVPDNAKWDVKWKKRDGEVWLSKGWKKFAEHYSLDEEYVLVFRYEGKSQFRVIILDRSASEIDYPLFEGTNDGEESGKSLEAFDGFSPGKRPKSPLPPFSHTRKKMKTNTTEKPKRYPSQRVETKASQSQRKKLGKEKFHADFGNAKSKNRGGRRRDIYDKRNLSESKAIKIEEPLEETESSSALDRAEAFCSENPFFIRPLHPTYLQQNILVIPSNPMRKYLHKNGSVTLWVSEDRTWDVNLKVNSSNGQMTLTTGWKTFVEDNNLKLDDVCVFELTEYEEGSVSFKIVIFRGREELSPSLFEANGDGVNDLQHNSAKRGSEGIKKECSKAEVFGGQRCNTSRPSSSSFKDSRSNTKYVSENHFSFPIKPTQLKMANIPMDFMRKYVIGNNVEVVTLKFGERSWPVRLDYYPNHSVGRFSAGWSAFVEACDLKAGDVCLFRLIDEENFVLEVTVSRLIN